MQPTTRTEPPDTQKNSELPKSRHFAAYSTYEHRPNPRAKSCAQKSIGQQVNNVKCCEFGRDLQSSLGQLVGDRAGTLAIMSARPRGKHSFSALLTACSEVHVRVRSW